MRGVNAITGIFYAAISTFIGVVGPNRKRSPHALGCFLSRQTKRRDRLAAQGEREAGSRALRGRGTEITFNLAALVETILAFF